MTDLKKRAERNGKVRRTISQIEQTIQKLERMKGEYLQKAVEARRRGESASYSLAKSGINATITQIRRAKEMLLNIQITAELQKMGDTNADFLKGMSTLSKRISKVNKKSDFVKLQKEIDKALTGVEEAQAGLDGFLQNSDAQFAAISSAQGALTDARLDEYIDGKVTERELVDDLNLEGLVPTERTFENGTQMQAEVGGGQTRSQIGSSANGSTDSNGVTAKPFVADFAPKTSVAADIDALETAVGGELPAAARGIKSPALCFVNPDGSLCYLPFSDAPNILIGGAQGSGKSSFINSVILSNAMSLGAHRLKLALLDGDGELSAYNGVVNMAANAITDGDEALAIFKLLDDEADRRYSFFSKAGARDISDYNAASSPLPYILVVIDEFAGYVKSLGQRFERAYSRLARQGGDVGIYTVISTRELSGEVITPLIAANASARICFTVPDDAASELVIGEAGAAGLRAGGELLVAFDGVNKYRSPKVTTEEKSAVIRALREDIV